MKNLVASTFATSALFAAAATGLALASPQADLGFDSNRMFFRFWAPGVDSGDFQVQPDNHYNPIVLPCDLQSFGGQIDLDYIGSGPTVFPKFTETFFNAQTNQQIISAGCTGTLVLPEESGGFHSMTAGAVQRDGYLTVSSTNQFCTWLFQPGDLPADAVVRVHLGIAAYASDDLQGNPIDDPDPTNNGRDIYVRRSCSCE